MYYLISDMKLIAILCIVIMSIEHSMQVYSYGPKRITGLFFWILYFSDICKMYNIRNNNRKCRTSKAKKIKVKLEILYSFTYDT